MPYKKPRMTPKAASRERSKLRAQGRFRGSFLRPPEIQSGVVMPVGAAIGAVYRAAASRRTTNAMMTPSQRRRANVDPVVVQKRLASLERRSKASPESQKRARASAARTKRSSEARQMEKMDDAARRAELTNRNPNKMVRRPRFTSAGSKRLAERKDALNSPTRSGYKPPAGGAKESSRAGEMRRRSLTQPASESKPDSMRFSGKYTHGGYKPAGGAPDGVKKRVKVPRRPKPTVVAPRRTQESRPDGTDKYGNRPGMTDAERMQARQKWREEQAGKPAKPKAPTRQEMEANKAAIAEERIKPVPMRPKTKVPAKVKSEEERISKQNIAAAEREAKAKADVAKPRVTSSRYKPTEQEARNISRKFDIETRRAAADARLQKDLATRKKGSRKP